MLEREKIKYYSTSFVHNYTLKFQSKKTTCTPSQQLDNILKKLSVQLMQQQYTEILACYGIAKATVDNIFSLFIMQHIP